jgi:hypothetical protein
MVRPNFGNAFFEKKWVSGFPEMPFWRKNRFSEFPKCLFQEKIGLRSSRNAFFKKKWVCGFPEMPSWRKIGFRDKKQKYYFT